MSDCQWAAFYVKIGVSLLAFSSVNDIVLIFGPYVKLHLLDPGEAPLLLFSLGQVPEKYLPARIISKINF